MGFFEFEDVWLEAAGTTGARAASSGASPPGGGGAAARTPATRLPQTGGTTIPARTPATPGTRPQAPTRPPQPGPRPSPNRPDGRRPSFDLDRFLSSFQQGVSTVQQGWDLVQQVPGFVQQFSGPRQQPGGFAPPAPMPGPVAGDAPSPWGGAFVPAPTYAPTPGPDASTGPPQAGGISPAANAGQIDQLLQALRQRQIPPLPGPYASPAPAPAPTPAADPMAMLRVILSNPQFLQALQSTSASAAPRAVSLPVPVAAAPQQMQHMPIPLGAVLNAIVALAGASMTDLNAGTREDEPGVPAYLVDAQGRFIVDPASSDDRAALVTHFFRLSAEAQGAGEGWLPAEHGEATDEGFDEGEATDQWAGDAGY